MSKRGYGCSLALAVLLAGCGGTPPSTTTTAAPTVAAPSVIVTSAMGSPHVGEVAPDFELFDQTGAPLQLSSLRGSVVVLAFVASFCPFSKAEQPHLVELGAAYAGKNVKVVVVSVDDTEADYRAYLGRMPMAFPVLYDRVGEAARRFTPPGAQPAFTNRKMALVSSNLVIDTTGQIRFFTVLDTMRFDAQLVHVRHAVDELLAGHPG